MSFPPVGSEPTPAAGRDADDSLSWICGTAWLLPLPRVRSATGPCAGSSSRACVRRPAVPRGFSPDVLRPGQLRHGNGLALGATGSRSAMLDRVRVSGSQPETEGCLPGKHPTGGRCQTSRQARDRRCRRGVRDARRVPAPSPARRSSPPPLLPPPGPAPPAPPGRSACADGRRRLHPPGRPSDDDRGPARPAPPRHRGPGRAAPTDPQTGRDCVRAGPPRRRRAEGPDPGCASRGPTGSRTRPRASCRSVWCLAVSG